MNQWGHFSEEVRPRDCAALNTSPHLCPKGWSKPHWAKRLSKYSTHIHLALLKGVTIKNIKLCTVQEKQDIRNDIKRDLPWEPELRSGAGTPFKQGFPGSHSNKGNMTLSSPPYQKRALYQTLRDNSKSSPHLSPEV